MTHMWKSKEEYLFDVPDPRIIDIYGKNTRWPLSVYLKLHNPKITKVRFDEDGAGVHIEVAIPKHPEHHPYFNDDDRLQLLQTYMDYANMSFEETVEWWTNLHRSVYEKG